MFKPVIAALAAAPLFAGAAFAGPYDNIETYAGWTGDDYTGATTDLHVGYEGDLGETASYYVQAGPAVVAVDGVDTNLEDHQTELTLVGKNTGINFKVKKSSVDFLGNVLNFKKKN